MQQAMIEFKALQRDSKVSSHVNNKASQLLKKVLDYKEPKGYDYELYLRDVKEVELFLLRHYPDSSTFRECLKASLPKDTREKMGKFNDMEKFRTENQNRASRLAMQEPVEIDMCNSVKDDSSKQSPQETPDSQGVCQEFEDELTNIKSNPDEASFFNIIVKSKDGTNSYPLYAKIRGFKPDKGVIEITSYRNNNKAFRHFNRSNVVRAQLAQQSRS